MQFDELHVISDLHLGGEEDFQIFRCHDELVGLLDLLCHKPSERRVALVINGDFVDFLAEETPRYFDPHEAVEKLRTIFERFDRVRDALCRYTATENHHLVIVLGNHDIEFALPDTREFLVETLCKGNDAARGRIHLSLDGSGWVGKVGIARVLCLHGNEFDAWNIVDHNRLRRAGHDQSMGHPPRTVGPNAGTKLVIDVINDVKRDFRFVDLLKPEIGAVAPLVVALDPRNEGRVRKIAAALSRRTWDSLRRVAGFLSEEEEADLMPGVRSADDTIMSAPLLNRHDDKGLTRELFDQAEDRRQGGVRPLDLVLDDEHLGVDELVPMIDYAFRRLRGKDHVDAVREALRGLAKDTSFDVSAEDSWFRKIDKAVSPDFDYVVAGHTHLERSLPRRCGRGHYFNTGTWAGLMQLTPKMLESRETFEPIFERLRQNRLKTEVESEPDLIMAKPACASIYVTANGDVDGALHRVVHDGGQTTLEPVKED